MNYKGHCDLRNLTSSMFTTSIEAPKGTLGSVYIKTGVRKTEMQR